MKKIILKIAGCLCLILGGIGIFLPVWPTTPFVLLAAGAFGASSPKMYAWLEHNKIFGEYIRGYRDKTGISLRTFVYSEIFLWVMLIVSAVLVHHLHVRIVLAVVGIAVTIHLSVLYRQGVMYNKQLQMKETVEDTLF
jgi:uncharacterized membrane protein YbaN (DUF454 family)